MHEDTPFEELPEYWRRVIRKLRRDARRRLREIGAQG
ncbi:Uncharacterised protein [Mycobacteroides abscessus subsp. abscessus]|nr:Uncharacterised protein [Mycobacteroides abscessus subsp. abscessus]SIK65096.1 Uncharacterised protein [Mycobacteroides abscessus subsp. abscessus]SKF99739.1 Uncharacterised protein [Mycobacteroides abscessus subsp. abscessus]